MRFYVDRLGFKLVADAHLPDGTRWVVVGPSENPALLALVAPTPDSEQYKLIGRNTEVIFLAEDVYAKFDEWKRHGIRFRQVPLEPSWKGAFATFEDIDGNSFGLVGFDAASRRIEAERRAEEARREAEQRTAQELEIARQVQARLFPQAKPPATTLDYAGVCIQARQVGGDYYDFLALGEERLGLVIGDIAGKGIAGALLMVNLQANLRSQCANAPDEPIARLPLVNQLFYDNTTDSSYATLFFAEYTAPLQRLRYANCGHLPGLLLRRDGTLETLDSTCTVLGLFRKWECAAKEASFEAGDLLVLYTDGLSEAANEAGDEYGEERLAAAMRRHQALCAEELVTALVEEVRGFARDGQQDDITLIVAKVKTQAQLF